MRNLHSTPAAQNVASLMALKDERLKGLPIAVLIGMARDGYDVYAYWPSQSQMLAPSKRRWKLHVNGYSFEVDEWLAEFNAKSVL